MTDINDDELQNIVEKNIAEATGSSLTGDKDIKAYSLIFEALGQQPKIPLAYNFSARVTAALLAKRNKASDLKLFAFIAMGFIIFMVATYFYLNSINSAPTSTLLVSLIKYKWILLFGIAALCIIQFLDKKMSELLIDR